MTPREAIEILKTGSIVPTRDLKKMGEAYTVLMHGIEKLELYEEMAAERFSKPERIDTNQDGSVTVWLKIPFTGIKDNL
jgi:hypothetical protein